MTEILMIVMMMMMMMMMTGCEHAGDEFSRRRCRDEIFLYYKETQYIIHKLFFSYKIAILCNKNKMSLVCISFACEFIRYCLVGH
jgi:hypothetical protein